MFKSKSWLEKLHPIVLHACKTRHDFIACYDSTIPFTRIHEKANKLFTSYNNEDFYKSNSNVFMPKISKNFWDFIENGQTASFHLLAENNVKIGPITTMRNLFPNKEFIGNQKNPDVAQDFSESHYTFKKSIALDYKNATGKTEMNGRNQVIIGNFDHYIVCVDRYIKLISNLPNFNELISITTLLKNFAKNHHWEGQLQVFANNLDKFPPQYLPPLFAGHKFPKQALTHQAALDVENSLQKLREISKKAYENNIPEDNFEGSHIQSLLGSTY